MSKGRLEAFSDAVIAIILTIMVLELPHPDGATLSALAPLPPKLLTYALSFLLLGIYWNNHHHLLQAVQRVNGAVLWANLHLLFWLSLFPFASAWAGDNGRASLPVSVYGLVQLLAALAYGILVRALLASHAPDSTLAKAIGSDIKGKISVVTYALGTVASFLEPLLGWAAYVAIALLWLVPDRRIERVLDR